MVASASEPRTRLTAPRLEARGVTKRYPGVIANDAIDLVVEKSEIHALLGENGAGKSTLVKMIYGLERPDEGAFWFEGEPMRIDGPVSARERGVAMVFQHFSLFDALSVRENIALGMRRGGSDAAIREVMERYGLWLRPDRIVGELSVGEKQQIEIVRALLLDPKLLIMDEPTSVLTPQEVAKLFDVLRALRNEGRSILYISHKLAEIEELCDAATILRHGKTIDRVDPKAESAASLAHKMVGETIGAVRRARAGGADRTRLVVEGLSLPGEGDFGAALDDVRFSVRAGEIFGIAGVAGNGQDELWRALAGERRARDAGAIRLDDAPLGDLGVEARRKAGLCAAPEERNGHAAAPGLDLAETLLLSGRTRLELTPWGWIRRGRCKDMARDIIEGFDVRASGPEAAVRSLSGGNLQKFLMGREITLAPEALICAQPTWGVDAAAAAAIRQALSDLAAAGAAIVVISQDLDELLEICDRLAVLADGRLSGEIDATDATPEFLGLLMGGVSVASNGEPLS